MLRHPELVGVEDHSICRIPEFAQRFAQPCEDRTVTPNGKVRHVLEQDGLGPKSFDDLGETAPEVGPRIVLRTNTSLDQAPDLGSPGVGEGLTGHAAGDEINRPDTPVSKLRQESTRVTKITDVPDPAEIGGMGLDGG